MNKRITSLFLTLVMVVNIMVSAVPVFAVSTEPAIDFSITADKSEAYPGDTITYTVTVGPINKLGSGEFVLVLPEELEYVSGDVTDIIKSTFQGGWVANSLMFSVYGGDYSNKNSTDLLTVTCKVKDSVTNKSLEVSLYDPFFCDSYNDEDYEITSVGSAIVTVLGNAAEITGISVNSTEHKTTYKVGETLDVTNLTILVDMSYGDDPTVPVTAGMVSGFDSSAVADSQTLTISYEEKTTTYDISISKADGTAITETLTAVKPTTIGGTDGKITGTTTAMEWKAADAASYTACTGNEITGLAAGTYHIRYKETDTHTAGTDTVVTVLDGNAAVIKCTVSFNANGGTGTMNSVQVDAGERYVLPENGFTAPVNKQFKAWNVNGTEKAVGETITVTADTEVKAVWEDIPVVVVTYDIDIIDGVATNRSGTVITEAEKNSIVYITADSAPRGKEFREWVVLSKNVTLDNAKSARTSFEMPAADVEIIAVYQDKESDFDYDSWYWAMMMLYSQKFTVTAEAGTGGSISDAGKSTVMYDKNITYVITPDEGYEVESVIVDGKDVGAVTEYTFKRVYENHSILVNFREIPWDNPFIDIFETDAYYDAIKFVYENGLFNGVSDNEFAPDTTMTRAMYVTVLGRLAGVDTAFFTGSSFDDVETGIWYAPYVEWAAREGIVTGYGDGKFGVDDKITVEQAMVILTRYADYAGIDTDSNMRLGAYSDADEVADWAVEQMKWVVGEGIYDGVDDKLNPKAPAKRSLVAEILYAFVSKFGE